MKFHELHVELWVPSPLAEVFQFFSDASNLETLTPPWMQFRIITPLPIEMKIGTLIDYRLRVHGVPLRWRSEISRWEPPHRFVDEQRRGPYRVWHHEHTFEERDGGTLLRDAVRYAVPFDFLVHQWVVRPDLDRIFEYRHHRIQELFGKKMPA
jgi:ligand-binding SRPBCC domain-containing protein